MGHRQTPPEGSGAKAVWLTFMLTTTDLVLQVQTTICLLQNQVRISLQDAVHW